MSSDETDYKNLFSHLCNHFHILSLDTFKSVVKEITLRTHYIYNRLYKFTYDDLIEFNNQNELFDLETLALLMYRPIQKYISTDIIFALTNQYVDKFVVMLSVYLCLNIFFEIVLFFGLKYLIINPIKQMSINLGILVDTIFNV